MPEEKKPSFRAQKTTGFHLGVHYFDFGTTPQQMQRAKRKSELIGNILGFTDGLRSEGVPQIMIQAVPFELHGLMEFIERQPFFDAESEAHRRRLFHAARDVYDSRKFKTFVKKAFEYGLVSLPVDKVLSGRWAPKPPDTQRYQQARRAVLDFIRRHTSAFFNKRATERPPLHEAEGVFTIYSGPYMELTESEKQRLAELVRRFHAEGRRDMVVTGVEVGSCINRAMEAIRQIEPGIAHKLISELSRGNREWIFRGDQEWILARPPEWCEEISMEPFRTKAGIRQWFGMAKK
jgi:hypothetical protein